MTRFQVFKVREVFGFTAHHFYCTAGDREHAEQMRALCDDPRHGYRGEIVPIEVAPTLGELWRAA